jgi:hypothetical protein
MPGLGTAPGEPGLKPPSRGRCSWPGDLSPGLWRIDRPATASPPVPPTEAREGGAWHISGRSAATSLPPPQPDPLHRNAAPGGVEKVLHRNVRRSTATSPSSPQRMPTLRQRARRTATVPDPPQRKLIRRKLTLSTQRKALHRNLAVSTASFRDSPQQSAIHRNLTSSTATATSPPQHPGLHRDACKFTATHAYLPQRSDLHRNVVISTATSGAPAQLPMLRPAPRGSPQPEQRSGERKMSSKLSVEEVLSNLERRAVFHREQEALHARQAVHHQEQQGLHSPHRMSCAGCSPKARSGSSARGSRFTRRCMGGGRVSDSSSSPQGRQELARRREPREKTHSHRPGAPSGAARVPANDRPIDSFERQHGNVPITGSR